MKPNVGQAPRTCAIDREKKTMSDVPWHEDAAKQARILQIIVGAMVAGASAFLAVALTVGAEMRPPQPILPVSLTLIAFLFVGIGLIARTVVLWNMTAKSRREIVNGTYQPVHPGQRMRLLPFDCADNPDPYRTARYLLSVFQHRTIISAALFEGWAFFATIAYLAEGNVLALALVVLLILGVSLHFPTQSRLIAWVERELETVEQEKAVR